ncbi:hypothetical protein E2562_025554 [Oryza meyeriana var. granulata]|uniref:Uncharacterized protein n=1 Tax=Oryza meyeriana var. granulata TaxID=110450 RepID=A0A6G1FC41_9ORYZ|nr:hypothetical protein E2562_025554 [Oryza meyeriana var. granulata]
MAHARELTPPLPEPPRQASTFAAPGLQQRLRAADSALHYDELFQVSDRSGFLILQQEKMGKMAKQRGLSNSVVARDCSMRPASHFRVRPSPAFEQD